jgi:hypothetical protein
VISAAEELVYLLSRRESPTTDLLGRVDPWELAGVVGRAITWPPLPNADDFLRYDDIVIAAAQPGHGKGLLHSRIPAAVFARAALTGDEAAELMAGDVNPLHLALLALAMTAQPANNDVLAVLDLAILADRCQALGES